MHTRVIVVALFGLATLTGCPSVSTTGMARTLNQGSMQGFVSPGFETLGGVTVPQVEVGGRYGVTDNIEFGAKAWFLGAGVDAKFALLRAPSMQGGVDLSLDPSVAYFGLSFSDSTNNTSGSAGLLTLQLPVLVGVNFSGHQLMIGPKAVAHIGSGGTDTFGFSGNVGTAVGAGLTLGIAFRLGDEFRLMPEVTLVRYLWTSSGDPGAAFIVQGGLNVLFGGRYEAPARPLDERRERDDDRRDDDRRRDDRRDDDRRDDDRRDDDRRQDDRREDDRPEDAGTGSSVEI